jgi:hypothetical protein
MCQEAAAAESRHRAGRRGAVAGPDTAAPSRAGLNARGRQPAGRRPTPWSGRASGAVTVSLAEHLHLGVGLVDVDGELIELLDELLDVLRLELGEVDRYP